MLSEGCPYILYLNKQQKMSKIYVAPNKLKNRVYKEFKKHCEEYGFVEANSSSLTLLAPAGITIGEAEFLKLVKEFLNGHECIVLIEPVTVLSDCLFRAGYKIYNDDLPQFHAHILIKDEKNHVRNLKEKWFDLVGASKKRLFHCEPIRTTILTYLDYITKFLEDKNDAKPTYDYLIRSIEPEEVVISHDEPATIFVSVMQTITRLFRKIKVSRILSKFLFSAILLLLTSSTLNLSLKKANPPPDKYQIKV